MTFSPADMYAYVLRHDLCAFIHRSFLELNPQTRFQSNWHIELIASKLEDVRYGRCKRLIVNVPPRHLKSHAISVAFPAWLLGHEPSKQILSVTYAQDLWLCGCVRKPQKSKMVLFCFRMTRLGLMPI
jgi:hypothetical protein